MKRQVIPAENPGLQTKSPRVPSAMKRLRGFWAHAFTGLATEDLPGGLLVLGADGD